MGRIDNRRGDRHLKTPKRRLAKTVGERAIRDYRRSLGLCPYCRGDEKVIEGRMCEACKYKARNKPSAKYK